MIPQGYKQTEIGVIPEDWKITTFKNTGAFFKGAGISMRDVKSTGYPCIMYGDIYVKFDTHFQRCDFKIDEATAKRSTQALPKDLFFTASGETAEEIGKCVSYQGEEAIYIGGDIIAIRPNGEFNSLFLAFVQNSAPLIKQKTALAQGHTVVHINKNNIAALVFAYPSLQEQERIANALLDVDNMISSLEKLIVKKKAVKQGAMQELLTGKKRLPGFIGEWIEKKIEDIVIRFATGLNPRQNFKLNNGGTNYYVTIKDFREGKLFLDDACDRIDNAALERINERSDLKKNDLLFSSIGRIGDAYLITETPKNWNINESVFALRPNQQIVSPLMLYYLLTSEDVKNKLLDSTTGSTLKSIKLGHLKEITCRFPKVIEEQTAIASILSDMDNEIEALEQKLAKTRQIKQGMMQQLLTGKIRLIEEQAATAIVQPAIIGEKEAHNHYFDDAVAIAAIVNAFYSERYPLGRKRVQKLLYLLRRKQEADTSAFKKKAAGPYADEVRYRGGEPIAKKNGYITAITSKKGTVFSKGEHIESALSYVEKWEWKLVFDWLIDKFKYTKTDELELLATIDMAMCDLTHTGDAITVDTIKNLIASNPEWKAKLSKTFFKDSDIAWAITMCKQLF